MRTYRAEAARSDRGPYLPYLLFSVVALGTTTNTAIAMSTRIQTAFFKIRIRVVGALNYSGERFEKNAVSVTGFTA